MMIVDYNEEGEVSFILFFIGFRMVNVYIY